MNLLQVRQKFVQLSGRYDLVVDSISWVDNGANFFIQGGQRLLDQKSDFPAIWGRYFQILNQGDVGATFEYCRAIQEVYVIGPQGSSDAARVRLEKVQREALLEYYNTAFTELEGGTPLYYTPALLQGMPPTVESSDVTNYLDFLSDVEFTSPYNYRGILTMPPTDDEYLVEVVGLFYQRTLTTNSDENFWSAQHPLLLVWSALWALETSYRNTEGALDWLKQIEFYLGTMHDDAATEDAAYIRSIGV